MTIAELLHMVDEIRPNQFSELTKTLWLSEIEHRVFDEVISKGADCCPYFRFTGYTYPLNQETVLAVPDRYADVYRTYIYAKIDQSLGEIDRYNNDSLLHSSAWMDYAAWYRRHHYPRERWHFYGKIALFNPVKGKVVEDDLRVPWSESDPRCDIWGVLDNEEYISPILPCNRCERAEGDDTDSTDNP